MGQAEGRTKSFYILFNVVFFSFITDRTVIDNSASEDMHQIFLQWYYTCVSFRATFTRKILQVSLLLGGRDEVRNLWGVQELCRMVKTEGLLLGRCILWCRCPAFNVDWFYPWRCLLVIMHSSDLVQFVIRSKVVEQQRQQMLGMTSQMIGNSANNFPSKVNGLTL